MFRQMSRKGDANAGPAADGAFPRRRKDQRMTVLQTALALLLAGVATPLPAFAAASAADPFILLEEVPPPRAMGWVDAHNAASTEVLTADPRYQTLYDEALA